jgi:hypothetical protein
MILRFRVWKWRFTFTFAPVVDVVGVNSKMRDGRHILMWDFDHLPLANVKAILAEIAVQEHLPKIYILESSKPDNYIAYCFRACSWWDSKRIVAATPEVDELFFKYGVYRGYWTLRVTVKDGYHPKLVSTVYTVHKETARIDDLDSWVVYETVLTA